MYFFFVVYENVLVSTYHRKTQPLGRGLGVEPNDCLSSANLLAKMAKKTLTRDPTYLGFLVNLIATLKVHSGSVPQLGVREALSEGEGAIFGPGHCVIPAGDPDAH